MQIPKSNSLKSFCWKGFRVAFQQCLPSPASDPAMAQHTKGLLSNGWPFFRLSTLLEQHLSRTPTVPFVFIIKTRSTVEVNLSQTHFSYEKQPVCVSEKIFHYDNKDSLKSHFSLNIIQTHCDEFAGAFVKKKI